MKAYQIFQAISPELGRSLFQDLRDGHRDAYKGVLISLAAKKRLRPVFVQRKPAPQQIDWLYKTCQVKPVDELAENILQVWLLKSQKPMLIEFLDHLGVAHEEDGTVEDLPDELDDEKLKTAVDALLKSFPPEHVALYLNVFQLQKSGGWENLRKLTEEDPRICLKPKAVPAEQTPPPAVLEEEAPAASEEEAPAVSEARSEPAEKPAPESGTESAQETQPKKKKVSRKKAEAAPE